MNVVAERHSTEYHNAFNSIVTYKFKNLEIRFLFFKMLEYYQFLSLKITPNLT